MFAYDVVLCTYNGERYIIEQLESIVKQRILPRKIVISDDGSTDNTLSLIAEFAQTTSVPCEIHRRTSGLRGPAHNFIYALSFSTAPYVFLSDQDDVWVTDKVEHYQRVVNETPDNTQPLLIFSDAELVDAKLAPLHSSFLNHERLNPVRQQQFSRLAFQNCIQGATAMMNQALIQRLSPSPHMLMHDWWLGMIAASLGHLVFIPHPLIKYRQHISNVVGSDGYGTKRILAKLMRLPAVARQNRRVIEQAASFYHIYADDLRKEDRKFLATLLKSRRIIFWQFFLLRFAVARTTLARTLSLYFLY